MAYYFIGVYRFYISDVISIKENTESKLYS